MFAYVVSLHQNTTHVTDTPETIIITTQHSIFFFISCDIYYKPVHTAT